LRPIDLYYLGSNAEKYFWATTASTAGFGAARYIFTGNAATLRVAGQMASFGLRAHSNAIAAVMRTPLVAGGSSVGSILAVQAAAIGAGYMIGATIGTGISQLAFGDEGAALALDLYGPGGADFIDDGLLSIPKNLETIFNHYF